MTSSATSRKRFVRRRYLVAAAGLVVAVALTGWLLDTWMKNAATVPLPVDTASGEPKNDFDSAFREGVALMQAGNYEQALLAWHQVLLLDAEMAEVRVNMGFTLFELQRYEQARGFFAGALEQNAYQANAYYGLAIVSEKLGDLEAALGAMRSYIHLAGPEQEQRFIRRARAALWEWEAQLERRDGEVESSDKSSAKP